MHILNTNRSKPPPRRPVFYF